MRTVAKLALIALIFSVFQALPVSAAGPPQAHMERFIVVLEDGVDPYGLANKATETTTGRVGFIYENSINGFMIEMPAAAVNGLRHMPGVAFIEPDIEVSVATQTESTGYDRIDADLNPSGADYSGIDIAVIDTGIWYDTVAGQSHEDLKLRWVTDCTGAILYPLFGNCSPGGVDGNGHGTHVAGVAAACDNGLGSRGIAPCATLWSFKALDDSGSGYLGSILASVDLVAANADQIDVANMSLTFAGESQALTDAIDAAVAQGVVFVVAAGNDSHDAGLSMPSAVDSAITVSSVTDYDGVPGGLAAETCYSDIDDQFAVYSNFGSKIDIAAPGTCIYSTWLNNTYHTASGTSMASPTVAGAVARYLHDNGLDLTSAAEVGAVRDTLVNGGMPQNGECGFAGDTDGFAEPLLFMNGPAFGGDGTCEGGGTPVDDPPTAVIAPPVCNDLTCDFDGSASTDDNGIDSWDWDFGDTTNATGPTPTHTYTSDGTYTVTLTVTDTIGQTNSTTVDVTVTTPPEPDEFPTAVIAPPVCNGLTCDFDGSASSDDNGIDSWDWDFGDTNTATGPTPTHTYTSDGTYTVTLTVTDTGGQTDSTTVNVTVTTPPVDNPPTAVIAPPVCTGLTCDFDGSASNDDNGIDSWDWDFGDTNTATGPTPTHTYTSDGTYTVTLTVTDTGGQTDSTTVNVTVTTPPVGDIPMTAGVLFYSYDGNWAEVAFYVTDLQFQFIIGAEATGTWSYEDKRGRIRSKTVEGTSDADGLVTIRTRLKNVTDPQFCIDDITKPGHIYVESPMVCTTSILSAAHSPW